MFGHDPNEELEADARAMAILQNSPYKDDLAGAGLFLKALALRAPQLPALIRPHFGSKMAQRDQLYRMQDLVESAPALNPASIEQTAALPLGGRVKLDPWNAEIELMKNNRVALLSAREKMEFMVTPLMPYLVRFGAEPRPVTDEDRQQPESESDDAAQEQGNGSNRGSD